jgi:hypothetical protein
MIPNHGAGGVIAPVAAASPRRFCGMKKRNPAAQVRQWVLSGPSNEINELALTKP